MWIRVPRNVFLIVGAVIGLAVAAPLVAGYATVWWWLSAPLIAAYTVVLWRWGLAWLSDDDAVGEASIWAKIGGVLILLGYSFVGLTLLVYLAMLAAQYWMMIAFSLIVCALIVFAVWLTTLGDKSKPPKPDDLVR